MLNYFYITIYFFCILLYFSIQDKKKLIDTYSNLIIFSLIVFFGTRYSLGGDFFRYECSFYNHQKLLETTYGCPNRSYEIGFNFLVKIFNDLNLNFLTFNILNLIFFCYALIFYLKKFYPKEYLFFFILCFPILILVMPLGSIRQGLAFTFFLLFFSISNKYLLLKLTLFIIPFLFHKSAIIINFLIILTMFMGLIKSNNHLSSLIKKNFIMLIVLILGFLIFFVNLFYTPYIKIYVFGDTYYSFGVFPRGLILSFFAVIIILLKNKNSFIDQFYYYSSFFVIVIFLFSFNISTIVDRVLLYLFPLIFHAINIVMDYKIMKGNYIKLLIFFIFFIYLYLWENFGTNYYLWDNYENYFL